MTIHFHIPGQPVGKGQPVVPVAEKWKHWTQEQIDFLRANYPALGLAETARLMGVSTTRIRHKASVLGLKQDPAGEFAKEWQRRAAESKIGKKRPAQADVIRSAILKKGLHLHSTETRLKAGAAISATFAKNGHPRGMAGKTHTQKTRARIAETSRQTWSAMTEDERASLTMKQLKAREAAGGLVQAKPHGSWKAGWREIDGQRCYFRSRWEANYARYLGFLRTTGNIAKWEHEPETFWFEAIKRGCRSYLPDFRVTENDGRVTYHEVKGWMDDRSVTKIKRMRIYHPSVKLIVIEKKGYEEIRKKLGACIQGWES